jgi:type IV pilus assembly protein PilA
MQKHAKYPITKNHYVQKTARKFKTRTMQFTAQMYRLLREVSYKRQINQPHLKKHSVMQGSKTKVDGFTLPEALATITIVGMLSTIAVPKYIKQVDRTRQSETASTIAQIQTTISAYADEFGVLPTTWADLNSTSAIMTSNGPATQNNFDPIQLPDENYILTISNDNNLFTIIGTNPKESNLDVIACINLTNGASAISQGNSTSPATQPNCG